MFQRHGIHHLKKQLILWSLVFLTACSPGVSSEEETPAPFGDFPKAEAPKKEYYTMEELGIPRLKSDRDYDGDGVDDFSDFVLGARKDCENHPAYDPAYVSGGYP